MLMHADHPNSKLLLEICFLVHNTTDIFPLYNIQYQLFADDTQSYGHCSLPQIPDLVFRHQKYIENLAGSYTPLFAFSSILLNSNSFGLIFIPHSPNSFTTLSSPLLVTLFSLSVSFVTWASFWTVSCRWSVTWTRWRAPATIIFDGCSNSVAVSGWTLCYTLWHHHSYWHASTAVTPFSSTCQCRQLHLAPLQRVQNTAARLVLGLDRRAHFTPALKNFTGFLSVNVSRTSKSLPSCTVYFTRTVHHISAIWLSLSTMTPPSVVFAQRPPEPPPPYVQGLNSAIARSPLQHRPPGTVSHRTYVT